MNQDEAQMLTQFKAMEADAEILSVVPREEPGGTALPASVTAY